MQEWVTVIIVLLIVAILLDGVRRMRIAQRDKIRMSRSIYKNKSGAKDEAVKDNYTSELPNGGARVINKREFSPIPRDAKKSHGLKSQRNQERSPQQTRLNLDESVPLLMESVTEDVLFASHESDKAPVRDSYRQSAGQQPSRRNQTITSTVSERAGTIERIEPTFAVGEDDAFAYRKNSTDNFYPETGGLPGARDGSASTADDIYAENRHSENTLFVDSRSNRSHIEDQQDNEVLDDEPFDDEEALDNEQLMDDEDSLDDEEPLDNEERLDKEEYSEDDYQDEEGYEDEEDYEDDEDDYEDYEDEDGEESDPIAKNQAPSEPEEVLIINIMAFKGETFNGNDLLDIVLKCGMRYGDMAIFHRYSDAKGEGALLFSMANMVKPGTFDLDAMEQFETPGVSLFMTLPLNADSMQSFELMVDTARAIAETLDGELKDEQRSVMTRQTIEHCRQRIRDFELKRLSRARH